MSQREPRFSHLLAWKQIYRKSRGLKRVPSEIGKSTLTQFVNQTKKDSLAKKDRKRNAQGDIMIKKMVNPPRGETKPIEERGSESLRIQSVKQSRNQSSIEGLRQAASYL